MKTKEMEKYIETAKDKKENKKQEKKKSKEKSIFLTKERYVTCMCVGDECGFGFKRGMNSTTFYAVPHYGLPLK